MNTLAEAMRIESDLVAAALVVVATILASLGAWSLMSIVRLARAVERIQSNASQQMRDMERIVVQIDRLERRHEHDDRRITALEILMARMASQVTNYDPLKESR